MKLASSLRKIFSRPPGWIKYPRSGQIYIVPTRFGFLFLFGIVITLIAGGGYSNNLVYLIGFFMLSFFIIAMVETNNNLRSLQAKSLSFDPAPEKGRMKFRFVVQNIGGQPRFNLRVEPQLGKEFGDLEIDLIENTCSAKALTLITGSIKCSRRGLFNSLRTKIATTYPLSLFYAWTWQEIEAEAIVYPAPVGKSPLPTLPYSVDDPIRQGIINGEDFTGHRRFQAGDSPRRIDWKAYARGRPLLIKQFQAGGGDSFLLSWNATLGSDQDRLRQLSAWIKTCQKHHVPFALELPGHRTELSSTAVHINTCLRLLSGFPEQVERTQ